MIGDSIKKIQETVKDLHGIVDAISQKFILLSDLYKEKMQECQALVNKVIAPDDPEKTAKVNYYLKQISDIETVKVKSKEAIAVPKRKLKSIEVLTKKILDEAEEELKSRIVAVSNDNLSLVTHITERFHAEIQKQRKINAELCKQLKQQKTINAQQQNEIETLTKKMLKRFEAPKKQEETNAEQDVLEGLRALSAKKEQKDTFSKPGYDLHKANTVPIGAIPTNTAQIQNAVTQSASTEQEPSSKKIRLDV